MKNTDAIAANLLFTEEKAEIWKRLRFHQFTEALRCDEPEYTPAGIGEYYAGLCGMADTAENLCTTDFASFCQRVTFVHKIPLSDLIPDPAELNISDHSTAYLQNGFSDKAYRLFSGKIPSMTAEYYPGFTDICEEVYDNRCRYAILPLHTSADGRLVSFQKLRSKYDLKICMSAEVELADEATMQFALLRKGIELPEKPEFMDITVVLSEDIPMGRFLCSCEVFGAVVVSMVTIPLAYTDDMQELCIHFRVDKADLTAMILFFEATHIRYTMDGIYSQIRP